MSWLLWISIAAAGSVVLAVSSRAYYRRGVRDELLAILKEKHPETEIVEARAASIHVKLPSGHTGQINLDNLYGGLTAVSSDAAARRAAIEAFAESLFARIEESSAPLRLEVHGDRLLPRLTPESSLASMPPGTALPHRPSGLPGLLVLYVLDSDTSVMYLTETHRQELGLDAQALHERAVANLRRTFPALVVRRAVDEQAVIMMKAGDSFDATRLLLVPDALAEGEELAAVIPDRETLGLMPVPVDGNWEPIRKLARSAASPYTLLQQPVRVTRAGFSAV